MSSPDPATRRPPLPSEFAPEIGLVLPETVGIHVANYHRAMMVRAAESIDLVPSDDRDISSLTLGVGQGGLARLKERVQRFRRELLELSLLEDEPERVVQLNFQLFPLSKARPEDP